MSLFNIIKTLGRPVAYGYHTTRQEPPYFCITGEGQDHFDADNTYYITKNRYQVEYYFRKKNEAFEAEIEALLLSTGHHYEKSDDIYIDDEDVFLIYYDI